MYTALYRSKRPEVFSEVLGQEHIVRILRNQIAQGTVNHAYLFCGTRGTGKTTVARLLAKAVNCLSEEGERPCGKCANCMAIKEGNFLDVIEIDAASNNSVDDIRELRDNVVYQPAVGRKKVYIIDEAHMLTTSASNALLKTLEEPPENVMFILATTDPQNLPQTILSRCLRLDFKRVPERIIEEHMLNIAAEQGITLSSDAVKLLASTADGSVRDGLSILDQCLAGGAKNVERDDVLEILGIASDDFFIALTEKVMAGDVSGALLLLNEILMDGKDVKQIMAAWLSHYRYLLLAKYIDRPEDVLNMSTENVNRIKDQAKRITIEEINNAILVLAKTVNDGRFSMQPRVLLELAIVTLGNGSHVDGENQAEKNIIAENLAGKASQTNSLTRAHAHQEQQKQVQPVQNPMQQPVQREQQSQVQVSRPAQPVKPVQPAQQGKPQRTVQQAKPAQQPQMTKPTPQKVQGSFDAPTMVDYGDEDFYDIDMSEVYDLMNQAPAPKKEPKIEPQKPVSKLPPKETAPKMQVDYGNTDDFDEVPNMQRGYSTNSASAFANSTNNQQQELDQSQESFETEQQDAAFNIEGKTLDREDLDELWGAVVDVAVSKMTALKMIETSVLVDLNQHEYKVFASNGFIKRLMMANSKIIDDAMEQCTGQKRRLIVFFDKDEANQRMPGSQVAGPGANNQGLDPVEEISSKLGIPVKVEN